MLAAGIALAAAPLWIEIGNAPTFWAMRCLALLAVGLSVQCWRGGPMSGFLAPSVLAPVVVLVLYCWIPALYVLFWLGGPLPLPAGIDPLSVRSTETGVLQFVQRMLTSDAERAVLSYVGGALVIGWVGARVWSGEVVNPPSLQRLWAGGVLMVAAGIAYRLGKMSLGVGMMPPMAMSLVDALPGLVLFCAALIVQAAVHGQSMARRAVVVALPVVVVVLGPNLIKTVVLFCCVAVLALALSLRGRARIAAIVALLLVPVLGIVALGAQRGYVRWADLSTSLGETLKSKLVERQAESVFCLHFALEALDFQPSSGNAAYVLTGLVPRALWADKPSLSNGASYSRRYCGVPNDAKGSHSASVTVLGEQAIEAGRPGIVAGIAALSLISLFAAWGWRRGGASQAAVFALSPWLLDFDQHLAMYVANIVKMLCAIAVGYALLFGGFRMKRI